MNIHASAEDYLETILILCHRIVNVRSVDIANELNYTKPSVSIAMKNLRENGYILVSSECFITITKKGKQIADKIYERHTILSAWLTSLGVDPHIAASDACKIEHVISPESFAAIKNLAVPAKENQK